MDDAAEEAGGELLDEAIPVVGWGLGAKRAHARYKADPKVVQATREVESRMRNVASARAELDRLRGSRALGLVAASTFLAFAGIASMLD